MTLPLSLVPALVSPSQVAAILGRRVPSLRRLRTVAELERAVAAGLPPGTVEGVVEAAVGPDQPELRRRLRDGLVHPSMRKRRLARLPEEPSARVERVARVAAAARSAFGDDLAARRFLTTPHALLGGRSPVEAALTELGARQVEGLLQASAAGLPL